MTKNRLDLEFAPNPRRGMRGGVGLLIVSAGVLAAAAIPLADYIAANAEREQTLVALKARHQARTAGPVGTAATDPASVARLRAARRVADRLTTPWADLFESLEAASNRSVALLSVEPSVVKHQVRVTAEAANARDMLSYVSTLQQDTRLNGALLLSHQVQERAAGTPIRFQIQVMWGAAP